MPIRKIEHIISLEMELQGLKEKHVTISGRRVGTKQRLEEVMKRLNEIDWVLHELEVSIQAKELVLDYLKGEQSINDTRH